jgi:hypothetical protein
VVAFGAAPGGYGRRGRRRVAEQVQAERVEARVQRIPADVQDAGAGQRIVRIGRHRGMCSRRLRLDLQRRWRQHRRGLAFHAGHQLVIADGDAVAVGQRDVAARSHRALVHQARIAADVDQAVSAVAEFDARMDPRDVLARILEHQLIARRAAQRPAQTVEAAIQRLGRRAVAVGVDAQRERHAIPV